MSPTPPIRGATGGGPREEASGRVSAFDAEVGLGRLEADDGVTYPFHCVAIADGSRLIAPGARVRFRVAPGLPGRWEAWDIRPDLPNLADLPDSNP